MESNITLHYFIVNKPFDVNNNISIHIMVQRINNFSTIRTGITHKSTHIHFYYPRPDIAETAITTTIQLVITTEYAPRVHCIHM